MTYLPTPFPCQFFYLSIVLFKNLIWTFLTKICSVCPYFLLYFTEHFLSFPVSTSMYWMSSLNRKQLSAFLEGFYDIIPRRLISIFNEQELELLLSGAQPLHDLGSNSCFLLIPDKCLAPGLWIQNRIHFPSRIFGSTFNMRIRIQEGKIDK